MENIENAVRVPHPNEFIESMMVERNELRVRLEKLLNDFLFLRLNEHQGFLILNQARFMKGYIRTLDERIDYEVEFFEDIKGNKIKN